MMRALHFGLGGLVGFVVVSGLILSSSIASADEEVKVSNVAISVPASCELSGYKDSEHSANVNNGTYQENIGKTTLTVFCNDGGGYAIYAVGFTGEVIGGTNSTKLVGEDYNLTIDTGTYTQGVTTSSVWAMKLNKVTDTSVAYTPANLTIENGFDSYHVVPSSYTKVASFTSTTDLTLGSKLETTYAAYVSGTQRADIYNGKVKYTLVHPSNADAPNYARDCTAGKICYWPNSSTTTDSMGDQTVSSSATEVTLWASNFKKQGYGFAGWSTTFDYSGLNGFLGPNEVIDDATILATIQSEGLSLYAYWIPSNGNLQGWTGCNAMNIGDVTALTDTRDNDTYAVAKLADNKCWIIENLRLGDRNDNNEVIVLSSDNTNNPSLPIVNSRDQSTGEVLTSSNSLSASQDPSSNPWCSTTSVACFNQSLIFTGSTMNPVANMTYSYQQSIYSYGNKYNWYSATAGNGLYETTWSNTVAEGDICPYGWRLPRGGLKSTGLDNNDFYVLSLEVIGSPPGNYNSSNQPSWSNNNNTEGTDASEAIRKFPNNMIPGSLWSLSAWANYGSFAFTVSYEGVIPATQNYSKSTGYMIRCIASY